MKYVLFLFFILIFSFPYLHAQSNDVQLSSDLLQKSNTSAIHDLSDPSTVNITIDIWGNVPNPGKYKVPYYTNINDLISYAGGPNKETDWNGIKIYRLAQDSSHYAINLNYKNYMDNETTKIPREIALKSGDILIIPASQKYTFRDYIAIITPIISLATFLLYFFRK